MIALAAYPLGARVTFLEPLPEAPMSFLAKQICGAYDDARALEQLAQESDAVTYEFENVPVASAQLISQHTKIFPPPDALRVSQDRWVEKTFFESLEIPVPKFAAIDSLQDLESAIDSLGLPAVLKTRRMGYDGKGQFVIQTRADIEAAWNTLKGAPLILEAYVNFTREVSILAVRAQDGECAFYPLVENHHRQGILRLSLAPMPNPDAKLQTIAEDYARRILQALNYVGVLAIEFFQVGDELVANEMAPRVHNSGHWTIEGAVSSQFENHARAILGLPLGAVETRGYCAMVNLIGRLPDANALLKLPDVHVHLYDKTPRAGRKLGHVTVVARDEKIRDDSVARILSHVAGFKPQMNDFRERLKEKQLFDLLIESLDAAQAVKNDETDIGKSHRKSSTNWIECLAKNLVPHYPKEEGFYVLARPIENKVFGLNELLYDIVVCSTQKIDGLTYVQDVEWQIESEFSNLKFEVVKDFNKLVLGSARRKLFIEAALNHTERLRVLAPAASACSGEVFVSFIPHPVDWSTRKDIALYKWNGIDWDRL